MKKTSPIIENGIVIGTASNKYQMKNPLARYLVNGFDNSIIELLSGICPYKITEVGCGEGHVTQILADHTNANIKCMDISDEIIDVAKESIKNKDKRIKFENTSIYDTSRKQHKADLVVCCEVLEHLDDPAFGLSKLAEISAPYALISVPREPIFRMMNFLRGAYIKDFGNSPGHLQHWSKNEFIDFVSTKFDIQKTKSPLPWTMLLAKVKQ